jgi:Flp pilus assembly protein TadG
VKITPPFRSRHNRKTSFADFAAREDSGAQLVEFAVALPLLVVFVVGIFDFSGAYTLKQKLTNIARDAARAAAADPSNDIGASPNPTSVQDAFWVLHNYLVANKINDCGIAVSSPSFTAPAIWKYAANSNGCVGSGIVVTINRGYFFPQTAGELPAGPDCVPTQLGGPQVAVLSTCVSVQYSYQWRFGRVASLLGSSVALPSSISATAVVMNEN